MDPRRKRGIMTTTSGALSEESSTSAGMAFGLASPDLSGDTMELKRPGNKGRSLEGTDSTIGWSDRHSTWVSYNTLEPEDDPWRCCSVSHDALQIQMRRLLTCSRLVTTAWLLLSRDRLSHPAIQVIGLSIPLPPPHRKQWVASVFF